MKDTLDTVTACRALLAEATPLKSDCGRVCGAACCRSLAGEQTGMQLFPGEEACYGTLSVYLIKPAVPASIIFCPGICERDDRPLACRFFPLLPVLRNGGATVEQDARAAAVCPLYRQGTDALSAVFVEAAKRAAALLAADPEQRRFLEALTKTQDEWKALRRKFGAG